MADAFDLLDDAVTTDKGQITDYTASRGELFGAGLEESFEAYNPTALLGRQMRYLDEDLKSLTGESERVDQKAAQAEIAKRGLDIKVPVGGMTRHELDMLQYLKQRELARQSIYERPRPIGGTAALMTGALAGSAVDPINIASSFIPVVPEARYAQWLARAGEGSFARAGVRAGAGAIEGAAGAAIVEPIVYAGATSEQADYSLMDSFMNVTLGGVLGGGLHAFGGAVHDRFTGVALPPAPDHVRRDALQEAAETLERGDVVDVEPMFAAHADRARAADAVELGRIKAEIEAVRNETAPDTAARLDVLQERAEALHPPAVQTFTTAKGSVYQVHEDGTTSRNKAFRPEHGEAEQGMQPRTERTVYITPDQASALATPQGSWRMFEHENGTVSLISPNKNGGWGASPSAKNIPVVTTPQKGLIPLELWKPDPEVKGPKGTAYRRIHFGNEITDIQAAGQRTGPRGLSDLIPEARADRSEDAFTRQFVQDGRAPDTAKPEPKDHIARAKEDEATANELVDEFRAEGRLTEEDEAGLKAVNEAVKRAELKAKAFEAAAACMATT